MANTPPTHHLRSAATVAQPADRLGGMMVWRMESEGYRPGQAWYKENNWVYKWGVFALAIGYAASFVFGFINPAIPPINPVFFHYLVWMAFLGLHLLDLTGPHEGRAPPRWNIVLGLGISSLNMAAASQIPNIVLVFGSFSPSTPVLLVTILAHLSVVAAAYLVHGAVNVVACLLNPARPKEGPALSAGPSASMVIPVQENDRAPFKQRVSEWVLRFRFSSTKPPKEPIYRLLHYLSTIPKGETTHTHELILAVANNCPQKLRAPVLSESPEDLLFYSHGSIKADLLIRFLRSLPELKQYVPDTDYGRQIYRPIVRKMRRSLRGASSSLAIPASSDNNPGVAKLAELLDNVAISQPVLFLCACTKNVNRSRTMKKVLDHFVRRNALQALVGVCSGGVDLTPPGSVGLKDSAIVRVLNEQNATLRRLHVHAEDWEPRNLSDEELRSATVIFTMDGLTTRALHERLRSLFPRQPRRWNITIPFAWLDTQRFGNTDNVPDPHDGQISVQQSVLDIYSVVVAKLLPVLMARASVAQLLQPFNPLLELPRSEPDRGRVSAMKDLLESLAQGFMEKRDRSSFPRLIKLVWATAYLDCTMLLRRGLPKDLIDDQKQWIYPDEIVLWNFLLHVHALDAMIPPNKAPDYQPLARLLRKELAHELSRWKLPEETVAAHHVAPTSAAG